MTAETTDFRTVEVTGYAAEAKDVVRIELRDPERRALPSFEPGAHIEMLLPNGLIRHYSLTNDHHETDRYVIAVSKVADSGGGSAFIHEKLAQGARLNISTPRNNFRLEASAAGYLFIAGGIGITPILPMLRWSLDNGKPFRLVYATRNRQRAAFYEDICLLHCPQVHWHFDDESSGYLDVPHIVSSLGSGELVYCCGPAGLMSAVRSAVAGCPKGIARFEVFSEPPESCNVSEVDAQSFEVRLNSSGKTFTIPPSKSILEVLEENGLSLPFSCREGMCGTCVQEVCAGRPEHHDYVLSDEEHDGGKLMTICVSRSLDPVLVLDI